MADADWRSARNGGRSEARRCWQYAAVVAIDHPRRAGFRELKDLLFGDGNANLNYLRGLDGRPSVEVVFDGDPRAPCFRVAAGRKETVEATVEEVKDFLHAKRSALEGLAKRGPDESGHEQAARDRHWQGLEAAATVRCEQPGVSRRDVQRVVFGHDDENVKFIRSECKCPSLEFTLLQRARGAAFEVRVRGSTPESIEDAHGYLRDLIVSTEEDITRLQPSAAGPPAKNGGRPVSRPDEPTSRAPASRGQPPAKTSPASTAKRWADSRDSDEEGWSVAKNPRLRASGVSVWGPRPDAQGAATTTLAEKLAAQAEPATGASEPSTKTVAPPRASDRVVSSVPKAQTEPQAAAAAPRSAPSAVTAQRPPQPQEVDTPSVSTKPAPPAVPEPADGWATVTKRGVLRSDAVDSKKAEGRPAQNATQEALRKKQLEAQRQYQEEQQRVAREAEKFRKKNIFAKAEEKQEKASATRPPKGSAEEPIADLEPSAGHARDPAEDEPAAAPAPAKAPSSTTAWAARTADARDSAPPASAKPEERQAQTPELESAARAPSTGVAVARARAASPRSTPARAPGAADGWAHVTKKGIVKPEKGADGKAAGGVRAGPSQESMLKRQLEAQRQYQEEQQRVAREAEKFRKKNIFAKAEEKQEKAMATKSHALSEPSDQHPAPVAEPEVDDNPRPTASALARDSPPEADAHRTQPQPASAAAEQTSPPGLQQMKRPVKRESAWGKLPEAPSPLAEQEELPARAKPAAKAPANAWAKAGERKESAAAKAAVAAPVKENTAVPAPVQAPVATSWGSGSAAAKTAVMAAPKPEAPAKAAAPVIVAMPFADEELRAKQLAEQKRFLEEQARLRKELKPVPGAPSPKATESTLTPDQKLELKLKKKLREIESLEGVRSSGGTLAQLQLEKLESKEDLVVQLAVVEARLAEHRAKLAEEARDKAAERNRARQEAAEQRARQRPDYGDDGGWGKGRGKGKKGKGGRSWDQRSTGGQGNWQNSGQDWNVDPDSMVYYVYNTEEHVWQPYGMNAYQGYYEQYGWGDGTVPMVPIAVPVQGDMVGAAMDYSESGMPGFTVDASGAQEPDGSALASGEAEIAAQDEEA